MNRKFAEQNIMAAYLAMDKLSYELEELSSDRIGWVKAATVDMLDNAYEILEENWPTKTKEDVTPYDKILAAYHEILPEWPKVTRWNDKRKRAVKARMKVLPDDQAWREYFADVRKSKFLMDSAKDHKIRWATFDWLINEANITKVEESKYHE